MLAVSSARVFRCLQSLLPPQYDLPGSRVSKQQVEQLSLHLLDSGYISGILNAMFIASFLKFSAVREKASLRLAGPSNRRSTLSGGKKIISSPQCPNELCSPSTLLSVITRGSFPKDKATRGKKLTTRLTYCRV